MKSTFKYILLFIVFSVANGLIGQGNEKISVPLTNPSEPGKLKIYNHNGTIDIEGYSGSTVEVEIMAKKSSTNNKPSRSGLKKIPKRSMGVTITEEDNFVNISASNNDRKDYKILVPKNFSLQVSSHHNGQVNISNVIGAMEVNSHHGGIALESIGGAVIADTHHGSIKASFTEVYDDSPMAFTTYHGDVDITFPSDLSADVKMKSGKGDIYTDFDFSASEPRIEEAKNGNRREIKIGGWTYGAIGSGGADIIFDTYHGDVIIRKL